MSGPVSTSRKIQPMHDPPVKKTKTKTVVSLPAPYPQSLDSPIGINPAVGIVGVVRAVGGSRADGRARRQPYARMSIPSAVPPSACVATVEASAAGESPTAISARGEPVDEQRSGSRRLRQAALED